MQFDRNKLKAVILHTCRVCPPAQLGAVKLHKVLYFLDMLFFAVTGAAVTGATYKKRPFGPTCVQLLPTISQLERDGQLRIEDVAFYGRTKKEYRALTDAEAGVLNDPEMAMLNEVIDFVCARNTASSISDYSHQLPWEMVEFGDEIPYESALLLFPNPISPETFERVKQGIGEIENPRSREDTLGLPVLATLRNRIPKAASRH